MGRRCNKRVGDTRGSEGTRINTRVERDIHARTNGAGSPKPSAMHRSDATMHSQNKGSDSLSISVKVEDRARTINKGGSRDLLRAFNS
jgi:hypothetical protein